MIIEWLKSLSPVSRMPRLMCSSISMLMCWFDASNVVMKCVNCYLQDTRCFWSLFNQFSCHRKSSEDALKERRRVSVLCNMMEPSLLQFYISRQWLNKFKTFAEPGPISNRDFLCSHGGMWLCNHLIQMAERSINSKPFVLSCPLPLLFAFTMWIWGVENVQNAYFLNKVAHFYKRFPFSDDLS